MIEKLDVKTWESLLEDAQMFDKTNEEISCNYIMNKYKTSRNLANMYKFALVNRVIIDPVVKIVETQIDASPTPPLKEEVTTEDIQNDIQNRRYQATIKSLKKHNEGLLREIDSINQRYDFALSITEDKAYEVKHFSPLPKTDNGKSPAVAVAILSDVHVEETVSLEMTNGLNEYNPEIAKERVNLFFTNLMKLVEKERVHSDINVLCLGLLGDFITGYIHEDLKESNSMSPTEATTFIRDVLVDNIIRLCEDGNFDKIIIPCTPGNHGRTTTKKRFATGYKNSYEWMMYQDMKKIFKDYLKQYDNKVEFIISQSELVYIDFYDYTLRFGHGDHFSYAGGIGGITIPLKKWLMRMNAQYNADMTFIGHWHNILTEVTEDCMVNGSVIGTNSYSMAFGGQYRRPQQIFTLLDKKRGFTIRTHIDVTE
jgi:hypothetical protein